jgi:hypothetical protein
MTQLIRTAPYHPYRVAIADDGSIWTQGIDALQSAPVGSKHPTEDVMEPYSDSGFLRHFDPNGKLLGSFVAQSTVTSMFHLTGAGGYLSTAGNRVGWFFQEEKRYIEIGPDGSVLDLTRIELPGNESKVDGIALTPSGNVFAAVNSHRSNVHSVCVLDRTTKTWIPVRQEGSFVSVYGSDGDILITGVSDGPPMRLFNVTP